MPHPARFVPALFGFLILGLTLIGPGTPIDNLCRLARNPQSFREFCLSAPHLPLYAGAIAVALVALTLLLILNWQRGRQRSISYESDAGRWIVLGWILAIGGAIALLAGLALIGSGGWPFSQQSRHINTKTGQLPVVISTVQRRYFVNYSGAELQAVCAGFGEVTIRNRSSTRKMALDLDLVLTPRDPDRNSPRARIPDRADLDAIARRGLTPHSMFRQSGGACAARGLAPRTGVRDPACGGRQANVRRFRTATIRSRSTCATGSPGSRFPCLCRRNIAGKPRLTPRRTRPRHSCAPPASRPRPARASPACRSSRRRSGFSASRIALITVGGAPIVPLSPMPLTPSGLVFERHLLQMRLDLREQVGARHAVIHEGRRQHLRRVLVVDRMLHQRLADALRDAAMDLAAHDHRIEHDAEIVDHEIAVDPSPRRSPDRSRVRRHASRSDGSADWSNRCPALRGRRPSSRSAVPSARRRPWRLRSAGSILSVPTTRKAPSLNSRSPSAASISAAAIGLAFSMMACGRDFQRVAADQRRARGIGAAADRDLSGIALDVADGLERHAQPFMHELREHRGMSLPVRMGAGDDRHRAARIEAQIHAVVEDAALLDIEGHGAAAQLAFAFGFLLARLVALPVADGEALLHHAMEFAGVIDPEGRRRVGQLAFRDQVAAADFVRRNADLRARHARSCAR